MAQEAGDAPLAPVPNGVSSLEGARLQPVAGYGLIAALAAGATSVAVTGVGQWVIANLAYVAHVFSAA